jgi:hypothetical protein
MENGLRPVAYRSLALLDATASGTTIIGVEQVQAAARGHGRQSLRRARKRIAQILWQESNVSA